MDTHHRLIPTLTTLAFVIVSLTACGDGDETSIEPMTATEVITTAVDVVSPESDDIGATDGINDIDAIDDADRPTDLTVESSWFWQLQGTPTAPFGFDVYDLDLFHTEPPTVTAVHDAGRLLICYFSAGSYEGWRPDAHRFAPADLGDTLDGFEDERWLDVRTDTVRRVVTGRLDRALELGCDGVEPDNVDGYANDTGFDLTAGDQLDFNRFVADAARSRGLLVGLKNDLDQIPELVGVFDFAVNEQCHEFDECELTAPFVDVDKPVFNAEYAHDYVEDPGDICERARSLDLRTLILPLDLDGSFRISCDEAP